MSEEKLERGNGIRYKYDLSTLAGTIHCTSIRDQLVLLKSDKILKHRQLPYQTFPAGFRCLPWHRIGQSIGTSTVQHPGDDDQGGERCRRILAVRTAWWGRPEAPRPFDRSIRPRLPSALTGCRDRPPCYCIFIVIAESEDGGGGQ